MEVRPVGQAKRRREGGKARGGGPGRRPRGHVRVLEVVALGQLVGPGNGGQEVLAPLGKPVRPGHRHGALVTPPQGAAAAAARLHDHTCM